MMKDASSLQPQTHADVSLRTEPCSPAKNSDLDWRLEELAEAIGSELADAFFWKAETGTIQTYEHRLTYRYVHIDSLTGQFFDQKRTPIAMEVALAHALPGRMQTSGSMLALAPAILEPNLMPFVRRGLLVPESDDRSFADEKMSRGAPLKTTLLGAFQALRARIFGIGAYAKTTALRTQREQPGTGSMSFDGHDLTLSAFTRKVA